MHGVMDANNQMLAVTTIELNLQIDTVLLLPLPLSSPPFPTSSLLPSLPHLLPFPTSSLLPSVPHLLPYLLPSLHLLLPRLSDIVHNPSQLDPHSPLLSAMATCHSLTLINGQVAGDPLDVKMFISTGWVHRGGMGLTGT